MAKFANFEINLYKGWLEYLVQKHIDDLTSTKSSDCELEQLEEAWEDLPEIFRQNIWKASAFFKNLG